MLQAEVQGGRLPRLLQAAIDAFSLPDLRSKILFTLALLAIYRFAAHIPMPGIDQQALSNLFENNDLLGFLDLFDAGDRITPELLQQRGFLRSLKRPVKIVGDGQLTKAVTVAAHRFTGSAREKIEAAKGKVEEL